MAGKKDIRWHQRLNNYGKALHQMTRMMNKYPELNDFELQGLIKSFEYTFELAWNVIKDYYSYQGITTIQGSRDAFRMAYNRGLIQNGSVWMNMIDSRILTVHSYDEETAGKIINSITEEYYEEFKKLHNSLLDLSK